MKQLEGKLYEANHLIDTIDRYLDIDKESRRIFQLFRRTLRAYDISDMQVL